LLQPFWLRSAKIVAERVFCYRNNLVGFATKISFLSLSRQIQPNIPMMLERKRRDRWIAAEKWGRQWDVV